MKTCTMCAETKDKEEFPTSKKLKDGKAQYCKVCKRERYRRSKKNTALKSMYGITLEEYDTMRVVQDHRCLICNDHELEVAAKHKTLYVDHCHTTGKVRGLLCHNCNIGLGNFRDNEERLLSAIEYLRSN